MSLDVWIVAPPAPGEPRKAFRRHVTSLEWNGYYQYLQRFWPATGSNGIPVDLYDTTHFEGAKLQQLRASLLRARMVLRDRPETWEEHIGRQTHPVEKELYSLVKRERLDALIGELLASVDDAERRRGRVIFEGD